MLSLLSNVAASLIVSGTLAAGPVAAADTLQAVTVVADKGLIVSKKDVVPIEKGDDISGIIGSVPGLSLSDHGSAAGLKSVSLRGLGTASTSIYIDGLRVGNVQSGQADLSFIDQANFSSMTIDYVQNSISFQTAEPVFSDEKFFNASARFMGGSFGTFDQSVRFDYRFNGDMSASANVSWLTSKGDFPYTDSEGNAARRENNYISQCRAGLDIFGHMEGGKWHAKAYYNDSKRGVAGSTAFPDNESRQGNRNGFAQFRMNRRKSSLYEYNITAKAAYDNLDYEYSYGRYTYDQGEIQLNSSHVLGIRDWWKLSLAAGAQWDGLFSSCDGEDYYSASRASIQAAVSTSLNFKRLDVNMALLYNGYYDFGKTAESADVLNRNCLSPSVDFRVNVFEGFDVTGFVRRAYRVPTFNELYYPGMGSTSLKPEDSWLADIGLEYRARFSGVYGIIAKLDGFHYSLTDKITSMPDPNDPTGWIWMMYNIGKVHDNGLEASLTFNRTSGDFRFDLTLRYSLQDAVDKTPGGDDYGKQIPYVAKHTIAAVANLDYMGWKAHINYNLRSGRNDTYADIDGELPAWNTLDVILRKSFDIRVGELTVLFKAANLFNERYEIVRYYPMPGCSFTAGIEISF